MSYNSFILWNLFPYNETIHFDYTTFSIMENKNPIQVADKLFKVLELLIDTGELGLIDLSKQLGINKASTHRLLQSLITSGYVIQNKSNLKYYPSFKICALSSKILEKNDFASIIKPFLNRISVESKETVHLVKLVEDKAVYIDKVEALNTSIRLISRIGKSIPLYCSAVGKALMSYMDDDKIKNIFNNTKIISYTSNTITNINSLLEVVHNVRKSGYALDNEEMEKGIKCIAIAINDFENKPIYAISISTFKDRMTLAHIHKYALILLSAKHEINNLINLGK